MTIECQYSSVLYCKLTEAGTKQSVSALRLGDAPHGVGQGPFHGARPGGDRYPLLRGGGCRVIGL